MLSKSDLPTPKRVSIFSHLQINTRKFRRAGDLARDGGRWTEACKAYAKYLKIAPGDFEIWIQYGHALKESGQLAAALAAYREAISRQPANTDARLHFAHLLKQLDQPEDARAAFADLLGFDTAASVLGELKLLTSPDGGERTTFERPAHVKQGAVFFEIKDLFSYLSLHTTVTGITRVTLGVINYVLEYMDPVQSESFQFVHQYRDSEGVLLISKNSMQQIVRAALADEPDISEMQSLLEAIRISSPVFRLERGDSYVILGAFWEFVANPSWIGGMRHRGVRIGAYIYDLIPITHAQYCVKGLTEAFTVAFAEVARVLDFALTISVFVQDDVRAFLSQNGVPTLEMAAVPLAHELRFEGEATRSAGGVVADGLRRHYLTGVTFVLCVCTIEARKNHAYLFKIWQRMIEARIDVPDLVFVGRPGWQVSELLEQIEDSAFLGGRLHILNGLTDEELSDLYERCLFTAFPSFVEGWGLPVGESLAHGKVCVASSTSSIPEVGGDHVVYFDPTDVEEGYEIISGLIQEPARLQELERRIRRTFKPRTWRDVGMDFFAKLNRLLDNTSPPHATRSVFSPELEEGDTFSVVSLGRVARRGTSYVRNPLRLAFAQGWRGVEGTGTWMLDETGIIRVKTELAAGTAVSMLIGLGTSPWVGVQNTLHIHVGPNRAFTGYKRPMHRDTDLWITAEGEVGGDGCITVTFTVEGTVNPTDKSAIPVALRLREISYVRADNLNGRIGMLKRTFLSPGSILQATPRSAGQKLTQLVA